MCNITKRLNKTTRKSGYKVALLIDGKYYSPATGVEYKVGKVPKCPEYNDAKMNMLNDMCNYFAVDNIHMREHPAHNRLFNGMTAVFPQARGAYHLLISICRGTPHTTVLLKIKGRCKATGHYTYSKISALHYILDVQELLAVNIKDWYDNRAELNSYLYDILEGLDKGREDQS